MNALRLNNEVARLEALCQYQILDTAPEEGFDDLTRLAAQICQTPIALISLVDADRQWFKSRVGLTMRETTREIAFCAHTILQDDLLIVRDASADERFDSNPLVTSAPSLRFYAGAPLITSAGLALGALSVGDYVPRDLSGEQLESLKALSHQVMTQLELRLNLAKLAHTTARQRVEEAVGNATAQSLQLSKTTASVTDSVSRNQLSLIHNSISYTHSVHSQSTSSMRTSEQIQAEIKVKFGFVPPFFEPAQQNPQVLENLWQQTLTAYVNNPLSALFKEKLSAYLSRFCTVPYCMICHSCSLHSLEVKAQEVLELLESPPPNCNSIDEHLKRLTTLGEVTVLSELNSALQESLLHCSIFISLEQEQSEPYRTQLRSLLGDVNYQHLVSLIAYIKTCHSWVEAHPEISYTADQRVLDHFDTLVEEEPDLANFFHDYRNRVQRERQSWTAKRITEIERQRHEQALRKAAAENLQLAQAVASASDGVLITDPRQPDHPIIYSNPAFLRMTGYQSEEVLGHNCRFLQGAGTDAQMIAQIRQAIAEQREVKATLLNYRKDGQPFWNELKIAPVFSDEDELLYFVGIQTDITERKQAEVERLRLLTREQTARAEAEAARNLVTNILESITDGFFALDNQWQFTYLNPQAEKLLQRKRTELFGKNFWDEFPQAATSSFYLEYHKAVIEQISVEFEEFYAPLNSWFECHAYPIQNGLSVYFQDITKRKQTEEILRESEERYRQLVESSPAAIFIQTEGKFVFMNSAGIRLFGATHAGDLLDKPVLDFIHPDSQETISKRLQELNTANQIAVPLIKEKLCRLDDNVIDAEVGATPFIYQGKPATQFMMRDITKRKQAEEALRESEERFRNLVETTSDWVWEVDENGFYTYVSPKLRDILGYEPEEILGKTPFDLMPPQEACRVASFFGVVAAAQQPFTCLENINLHKNGYLMILETSGVPVFNADGTFRGYRGMDRDITERKQAEQKIREQAALLDIATDAILVRNLDHQILFWNKGAELLYGWKKEEVLGKDVNKLLYTYTSPQLREAQKTVTQKGEWQGELHKITKDGKEVIVQSRWTLVYDDEETPKSILVVDTDITQKKQLEKQFLRTQRMESIGTLAGGIAHDLNNVLAPILMAVQLLALKLADEQSQQLLETLEINAKRGADLVKQVLSFARGIDGERTVLQVKHLILEIKQIAKETFPKSLEFYTDLPHALWPVAGDATQLHQVFINLCVNARDAMPDGGTLSISAENIVIDEHYARMHLEAQVGSYIVVTVADTGTGISPEILDRIFEPFFTTKELGKGTGLGLSTVLGIIKSHGGFVNVTSAVGKGTEFKVYLPAVEATETEPVKDLEMPTGNGELILVVDDEAAIREITQTSLVTFDYQVMTASDGIEAIALYAQHKNEISLVLVDMMMPSMDGPATIRTLQRINPQIKIIAVSGLISNEKFAEAAGSGVKTFLLKPYTAKELLKTIYQVLST